MTTTRTFRTLVVALAVATAGVLAACTPSGYSAEKQAAASTIRTLGFPDTASGNIRCDDARREGEHYNTTCRDGSGHSVHVSTVHRGADRATTITFFRWKGSDRKRAHEFEKRGDRWVLVSATYI